MYTGFFKFREKPFSLLPDPRFVVLSADQREALSTMIYAVERREGWALLLGGPGGGKTTLVAALKQELGNDVICAVLEYPRLDVMDFFHTLGRKLGLKGSFASKGQFVAFMEQLIARLHQRGKTLLVVIDEAHNLSLDVLEELRLLSNLDALLPRVLHIYLVGQPELINLLRNPRCGGLLQRLRWRIALHSLSAQETAAYVRHRILVADGNPNIFDQHALDAVFQTSRGVPRLINMVCDEALLMAYLVGSKTVTRSHVMSAAEDLDQAITEHDDENDSQPGVLSLPFPGQEQAADASQAAAPAQQPPAQPPAQPQQTGPIQAPPPAPNGAPPPFGAVQGAQASQIGQAAPATPAGQETRGGQGRRGGQGGSEQPAASQGGGARGGQPWANQSGAPQHEPAPPYHPQAQPAAGPRQAQPAQAQYEQPPGQAYSAGPNYGAAGGGFRPPAEDRPPREAARGPFNRISDALPKARMGSTGGFKKRVLVLFVLLLIVGGGYLLFKSGGLSSIKSQLTNRTAPTQQAPAKNLAPNKGQKEAGSESRLTPARSRQYQRDGGGGMPAVGGSLGFRESQG